ncbi:MAG: DNA topoisomerase, partial [Candidatus Dadabacteria bacterium]
MSKENKVLEGSFADEATKRYLAYAHSVIVGRALPDIRDGLKPVQRRIIYTMFNNLKLFPDKPFRKCAAVVGEVLAKYHPHGDVACYDALVRLAQPFATRYPLIEGQGNFGSLDGDHAAAYRYTEARLTHFALEVIGEIEKEAVKFIPNFDETTFEPEVLPSRVPTLLLNGSSGIAVGIATNIPPHNLLNVVKALQLLLKNPRCKTQDLLTALEGPDFPTGGSVVCSNEKLLEIYETGKGSFKLRGKWQNEIGKRGKNLIVIKEVPYTVNKASLVEKIADLIREKKVPQLTDVRDESTEEVRIVLELAKGADADKA